MESGLEKNLKACRRVSVPIVSISTADMIACRQSLRETINGSSPLVSWDMVSGLVALNDFGAGAIAEAVGSEDPSSILSPDLALNAAARFPEKTILIMMSAHMWLADSLASRQALLNLRDAFKADQRMIVLLTPSNSLPVELQNSIETFEEKLPDRGQVKSIVSELMLGAGLEQSETVCAESAEALVGLSAFAIEQAAALALNPSGISIEACWARKKAQVEQTPGLSMSASEITFNDVGGLGSAKEYFGKLFAGPKAPKIILRIEEIEKLMAGSSTGVGDNTGVSQDQLQVLLDRIERNKWLGALFLGPGGSGKSYFSEALAGQFGVRAVSLDTGAMKTSALGASEQSIRSAMRVIEAIGGDRVLIAATCNGLDSLKPELQRRLASAGMWFFDLPDDTEKELIWRVQTKAYGLQYSNAPDKGWSSSDIRDCCRTAYLLNESLLESSQRVNCAMAREPERIESLRRLASNRMLSASYRGAYRYQSNIAAASGRKIGGE